jgi:hypothetical protein
MTARILGHWTRSGALAGSLLGASTGALLGGAAFVPPGGLEADTTLGTLSGLVLLAALGAVVGAAIGCPIGTLVGLFDGAVLAALSRLGVWGTTPRSRRRRVCAAAVGATVELAALTELALSHGHPTLNWPDLWVVSLTAVGAVTAAVLSRRLPPGRD